MRSQVLYSIVNDKINQTSATSLRYRLMYHRDALLTRAEVKFRRATCFEQISEGGLIHWSTACMLLALVVDYFRRIKISTHSVRVADLSIAAKFPVCYEFCIWKLQWNYLRCRGDCVDQVLHMEMWIFRNIDCVQNLHYKKRWRGEYKYNIS